MSYQVETTPTFDKEFKKLDIYIQKMLKSFIEKKLIDCSDPRLIGKPLTSNRNGQWRYRVGNYRIICVIEDEKLVILALSVGHRKNIYK